MILWRYKDSPIIDLPDNIKAFVYMIRDIEDGYYYIGKKNTFQKKAYQRSKKKLFHYTQSNWKNYWGSSKSFNDYIKAKGKHNFERIILHLCTDTKIANYLEIQEQFKRNVLYDELSFNNNIAGRYYFNKKVCEHYLDTPII
jgi:hypothetical protein